MSLAEAIEMDLPGVWSQRLGEPVHAIEPCTGGRNHRVYRLISATGHRYVGKCDFAHGADGRRRVGVEFSSLRFLWNHGVRCIPQPLGADHTQGWAVYAYVDGRQLSPAEITDEAIEQLIQFARQLKALRTSEGSRELSLASEACFSVEDVLAVIHGRLERLRAVSTHDTPITPRLQAFLAEEFVPQLERMTQRSVSVLAAVGASRASRLARERWTLSPSDFGFHNALKRADGQLIFLDFEYFGWDDPAKMLDDLIWHPGMSLAEGQARRVVTGLVRCFEDDRQLATRAEILWPLCGLNWCLIFLNEFIPSVWLRRSFASGGGLSRQDVLAGQLAKARDLLTRVIADAGTVFHHV